MINGKEVIAFTPYGRELTVSILYEYLKRDYERGIVDKWMLWMNTDKGQYLDREYAVSLAARNKWIELYDCPVYPPLIPKQLNTGTFYRFCDNPDAMYVRFDDDIVYIEENAIERLVINRIETDAGLVNFPVMINNAITSHFLQALGKIPKEWGLVGLYCMDANGWASPEFGEKLHTLALDKIEAKEQDHFFLHMNIQLPGPIQYSVSSFAAPGTIYQEVGGDLGFMEEENWHTVKRPQELSKPNIIVANSLVSHFSFYTQRGHLLETNILDRYRELSERL
jgi:hypothetical protein